MAKTHFDPYFHAHKDDPEWDSPEFAPCGTRGSSENYDGSGNWDHVTCKKCLKKRVKLQESFDHQEKMICDQMGDMVEWWEHQQAHKELGNIGEQNENPL